MARVVASMAAKIGPAEGFADLLGPAPIPNLVRSFSASAVGTSQASAAFVRNTPIALSAIGTAVAGATLRGRGALVPSAVGSSAASCTLESTVILMPWAAWDNLTDANYYRLPTPGGSRGTVNVGNVAWQAWFTVEEQGGALASKSRYIVSSEAADPNNAGFSLLTSGRNDAINLKTRGANNQIILTRTIDPTEVGAPMHVAWSLDNYVLSWWVNGVRVGTTTTLTNGRYGVGSNDIAMGRRPQPSTTDGNSCDGAVRVHGWSCGAQLGTSGADALVTSAYNGALALQDIIALGGSKTEHLYSAKRDGAANSTATDYVGTDHMTRVGSPTYVAAVAGPAPTTVTVNAPAYVLPDSLVPITATAVDATGVQYYLDGAPISGVLTTAPYAFEWDAAYTDVGPHVLTARATNAAGATVSATTELYIELFAGLGTKVGQGTAPVDKTVERVLQAGATLVRTGQNWDVQEKTPNVYNFSNTNWVNIEAMRDQLYAQGVHATTMYKYGNGLRGDPELDVGRGVPGLDPVANVPFGNWARAYTERLGPKVRLYSIWNEYNGGLGLPNHNWRLGTTERYLQMSAACYPRAKLGNPKAIITGPVGVFAKPFDYDWLNDYLQKGGGQYLDWLDIHTYPNEDSNRRAENHARWVANLSTLAPSKGILISEYGYSTYTAAYTMQKKCEEVARFHLACKAYVPKLRGIVWYELRDVNTSQTTTKESCFGLCNSDANFTPHPAFWTYQDIAPVFKRARLLGRAALDLRTHFVRFRDETGSFYAAWREEDGSANLSFTFTASAVGSLSVRSVKTTEAVPASTSMAFSAGTNTLTIPLTTMPKFIRVPAGVTITPASSYGFLADNVTPPGPTGPTAPAGYGLVVDSSGAFVVDSSGNNVIGKV